MVAPNGRQRYFVLVVAILHELVYGLNYPSIQWNYQNTRFKQDIYHLNVLPDAKVMVICPHTAISLVKTSLQAAADNLFENFWQVDKASFQSCNVNTSNPRNKLFFKCEDPQKLQYEQFIFQSYGIGNRPTFEKGKTHYFISTANGSKESLDRTSGGHCDEYNMRLKIYVCQNSADVLCSEAQTTTSTTAPTTAPTTASTVPVNGNNVIPALAANAPPTRRTQNVFERNDDLHSEAQTTRSTTDPTLPVNETDGVSPPAAEALQNVTPQNVCERNGVLMPAIIILGVLLLISLIVNVYFIVGRKNRKTPTDKV